MLFQKWITGEAVADKLFPELKAAWQNSPLLKKMKQGNMDTTHRNVHTHTLLIPNKAK